MTRGRLERIDMIAEQLRQLRVEVQRLDAQEPPADTDDLAEHNLLDTTSAAERFSLPQDTARRWCREGCGVQRGRRWLASIPRFQRRLGG